MSFPKKGKFFPRENGYNGNSQHLFSRTDILAEAGIDSVPGTYDEVLAAAQAIREAGIMEYPIVMNMKTGWNVGESFRATHIGSISSTHLCRSMAAAFGFTRSAIYAMPAIRSIFGSWRSC